MEEWQTGGGLLAGLLTALLVWLRRRSKGGRLRARFDFSYRAPRSSSTATPSSEPPPYPSEPDTPSEPEADTKPRKGRRRD